MSTPQIEETTLPGVGTRRDFVTDSDNRIGVLNHHSGRLDLLLYDDIDPDVCRSAISLTEDEGRILGQLLGTPQVMKTQGDLQQTMGITGLSIDWITIADKWVCADKRIDALQLTKTGVLIVAVIRDGETTPVPQRDFELHSGDTVVVIGTPDGIQRAYAIMHGDG